jgi:hypothetical protein
MAEEVDIDNLLSNWFEAKQRIADLEKKCDKYKAIADKVMNIKGEDSLKSKTLKLTKTDIERESISKKDVPKDIWKTHAKLSSFSTYRLTQIKKSKFKTIL